MALARRSHRAPKAALRSDRLSSYDQWSMPLNDALMNEYEHGMATLRTGELIARPDDYASGGWRTGDA
jgi:enoyl-CoA hydratase